MTDRAEPGDPQVCGFEFDSTMCVAAPGHPGPHITSNASYPYGLTREPRDPMDLDQPKYRPIEPNADALEEYALRDLKVDPHHGYARQVLDLVAALRDARQRVTTIERMRLGDLEDVTEATEKCVKAEAALAAAAEREARYRKALQYVERKIDEHTVDYDWDTFVRTVKGALS